MTLDLELLIRRVLWYETPEVALRNPVLLLSHVMTYGTIEDVLAAKKFFSEQEFRYALEHAPAGIFDKRSWTYWHVALNILPVPPLPVRACTIGR